MHSCILEGNYAVFKAKAYKTKANLDSNTNNSHIFSVLISREPCCFPPLLIKQKAHVSFSQPSYCWTLIRAVIFSFLCWRQLTSNHARAGSLEWQFLLKRPMDNRNTMIPRAIMGLGAIIALDDTRHLCTHFKTGDVTWSPREQTSDTIC